jgi:hypothetical protein
MNDDLEHTLRDSLDRHAADVSRPAGTIDDVYHRADRRHARRRSIAVLGSVVAVGVGVAGFAALAGGADDPAPSLEGALGTDVAASTTTYAMGATTWSCAGYLGSDGDRDLYADCHPVTDPACAPPTSNMPLTVATVVEGASSQPEFATTIPVTDPCAIAPTYDVPECAPLTTPPPVATTIAFAEGTAQATAPDPVCDTTVAVGTVPTSTMPWPISPAATAPATSAPPVSSSEQTYTVVAGDTLTRIAALYGVEVTALAQYNWPNGIDSTDITPGQVLRIPPGARLIG